MTIRGAVTQTALVLVAGLAMMPACATPGAAARTFEFGKSYTIVPAKGIAPIQLGASRADVEAAFGTADQVKSAINGTCTWMDYYRYASMDFLLLNKTGKVIEIRFDKGFLGALPNGIELGDSMADVLQKTGGATKRVEATREQVDKNSLGDNRVLYHDATYETPGSYKYIDAPDGMVYWFGADKKLTLMVVVLPSEPTPAAPAPTPAAKATSPAAPAPAPATKAAAKTSPSPSSGKAGSKH